MRTATVDVQIQISTWRSRLWIRVAHLARLFIGSERAYRWGVTKALGAVRVRLVGTKRWSRI